MNNIVARFPRVFACAVLAAAMSVAFVQSAPASTLGRMGFLQPMGAFGAGSTPADAAYCRSTGGVVEVRTPVYGTNNSSTAAQLVLSGHAAFCQYTLKKGGSRIYVLLTTLNATMPTLAALAYYAKVPTSKASCPGGANPASCYCSYLGGSDQFGGTDAAGGAWVLKNSVDVDLEACIFPDMSSIDSWGLAYHANNVIRGINLAKVLKYKGH